MASTLLRALVAFAVLFAVVLAMAITAVNSLASYPDAPWWSVMIIILLSMVISLVVYFSTLARPVYEWIAEPAEKEAKRESAAIDARRASGGAIPAGVDEV